ncbi:MAG TPA: hypothetical protein VGI10_01140 [Polyangiaceae bacterium]
MLAATLWQLIPLWGGRATVQTLKYWFWPLRDIGVLRFTVLGAALFALPYVIRACAFVRSGTTPTRRILLLVAWGFVYQQGLALTQGRGFDVMASRMIDTGHAEFAVTASRDLDAFTMLRDYEGFVQAPDQRYARSKPPGQLLFYVIAARVADRVMPWLWDAPIASPKIQSQRHARLVHFATLFFPLIGLLVLFPLSDLARHLLPPERALWPALLYLSLPAPALVQMHLDQVLYPSLATWFWALCARYAMNNVDMAHGWRNWAALGALAWVSLFVSFSLLPILPIGAALACSVTFARTDPNKWRQLARATATATASYLVISLIARWILSYDPFVAYARCMANHSQWKTWQESLRWPAAKLNLIELAYWLGAPMVVAFTVDVVRSIHRPFSPAKGVALATLLTLLATAFLGRTLGEVARLWLFFLPVIAVSGASGILELRGVRRRSLLTGFVGLGVLWTFALKAMQDFY